MTREELNQIAETVRQTKTPYTISSFRALLSAFYRSHRTTAAIETINGWLFRNRLKSTTPIDEWYPLGNPVTLGFLYHIKHNSFQPYSIWIDDFKNLHNFKINFEPTEQYSLLIGLNGSGKSNVLEVVSAIFYSLYRDRPAPFRYKLSYILNGNYYEITDGKIDGYPVTLDKLPKNVVASYSGEDDRMWHSYYLPLYETYCRGISDMPNITIPPMLFVGKEQWEVAFLTLLYARRTSVEIDSFLKSIIGESDCSIDVKYNDRNLGVWKETIGKNFVRTLKQKQSYSENEFCELIYSLPYVNSPSALFSLLYQTTVKQGTSPIDAIEIAIPNYGNLTGLSEGEKKMIVVNTIMNVLSSEQSLCIFDEPDAHVHVSRKKEMLNLIDIPNRYSLLTTHSPIFFDENKIHNILYIKDGIIEETNKLQLIKDISDGAISYVDAAYIIGTKKKILLTEGSYDKKYIEKAIDVLGTINPEYFKITQNVTIIKTGGTGETRATYEELVTNIIDDLDRVVFLFDYDKGGLEGWSHVSDILQTATPEQKLKIIPLFYQHDYTIQYNTSTSKIKADDSYTVEDLFNPTDYASVINDVISSRAHKDFRKVMGTGKKPVTEKIKEYIQNNYSSFSDYSRFTSVLDKLLDIFGL